LFSTKNFDEILILDEEGILARTDVRKKCTTTEELKFRKIIQENL